MKLISYPMFKAEFFKKYPKSTYRLGQSFINTFIKKEDNSFNYNLLWNAKNVVVVDRMVYTLISQLDWDMNSLQQLKQI